MKRSTNTSISTNTTTKTTDLPFVAAISIKPYETIEQGLRALL